MTIDIKKLQKAIAAEVNRREYERVASNTDHSAPTAHLPNDLVRSFEVIEVEGFLPPVLEKVAEVQADYVSAAVEQAQANPDSGPPSLYRRLRGLPLIGKVVGHRRVMHFLTRAQERPGGASVKNIIRMLAKAVVYRIPKVQEAVKLLRELRVMTGHMAWLQHQLNDTNARLRNVGLQLQSQVNQGLYSQALSIEQNEQFLVTRMERVEQRQRELSMLATQTATPSTFTLAKPGEEPGMPHELYVEFEANFRGSKEMIRERLKANLPYFQQNVERFSEPVLDLGCGRGEWLQLLKEAGVPALGVDSNTAMIQCCTDAGLEAYVGDALQYLAAMPAGSLGGLTAFHIIEHLPLDVFIKLIDEAKRVVRSGGVVLFETPNPENLIVGACNFYIDPTHRNPLPPALVGFLLKARGFERVEIDRRHPGDPALLLKGGDESVTGPLNRLLFGAQDYAAIGYAP